MAEPRLEIEIHVDRLDRAVRLLVKNGALVLPPGQIKEINDILNGVESDDDQRSAQVSSLREADVTNVD